MANRPLWLACATAIGAASSLSGCALTGHQIVQNRQLIPGGATQTVVVDCPAGKKVLGGGFSTETPDDIKLFASDPSDGRGKQSDTEVERDGQERRNVSAADHVSRHLRRRQVETPFTACRFRRRHQADADGSAASPARHHAVRQP